MIVLKNEEQEVNVLIGNKFNLPVSDFDLIIIDEFSEDKKEISLVNNMYDRPDLGISFDLYVVENKIDEDIEEGKVYLKAGKRYLYKIKNNDDLMDIGYLYKI